MLNEFKAIAVAMVLSTCVLVTAGCVTTPADPDLLLEADDAIELAERSGARDHAPLELDQALELRERAAALVEQDEAADATRMAERAAMQARLAIVRAEGQQARDELRSKRSGLEQLRAEMRGAFGDEIDLEPAPGDESAGDRQ